MAIRGFSFIEIRSIAGSLTLDPKAVTITAANLRAQGRVIKTNVSVELAYDAVQRAFGFMAAIDEFGLQVCWGRGAPATVDLATGTRLGVCRTTVQARSRAPSLTHPAPPAHSPPAWRQDTLKALGVNVNLGPADIKIRNAMVLFASKAVNANGRTFQAGLYTQGELQL